MEHPNFCYSKDYQNNCTIVKWGEGGYHKTDYPQGKYTDQVIDQMNAQLGITPEEKRAMIICSMVAQDKPELNWEEHYLLCLDNDKKRKRRESSID